MLRSFTVRNFRNATAEDLPLARVNLLIGPNNSGKTNLMRAMGFATLLAEVRDDKKLLELIGGRGALRRDEAGAEGIFARWEAATGDVSAHGLLELSFGASPHDRFALTEGLEFHRGSESDVGSLLPRTPEAETLRRIHNVAPWTFTNPSLRPYINGQTHLALSRISPQVASEPSPIAPGDTLSLGPAGEGLPNVLRTLEQVRDHGLEPVEARLRELMPDLKRIVVREGGQYRWLELLIGGQRYSLPEMSDGTLKALILATLLEACETGVFCVDEPELNQHPAWLRRIGAWLQRPTGSAQVVVSTHSSDLLDAFTEGFRAGDVGVVVCDSRPGTPARTVDAAALDDLFREGWELGDLYRVGEPRLGGWPW